LQFRLGKSDAYEGSHVGIISKCVVPPYRAPPGRRYRAPEHILYRIYSIRVLDFEDQWDGATLRGALFVPLLCFGDGLLPVVLRQQEELLIGSMRPQYNIRCNEVKWRGSFNPTVPASRTTNTTVNT
jgi:hypothetical protein